MALDVSRGFQSSMDVGAGGIRGGTGSLLEGVGKPSEASGQGVNSPGTREDYLHELSEEEGEAEEKPLESARSRPAATPRKKTYECTFPGCEKRYTRPVRLEEHLRSHTGERPFVCEACGASFHRESHLKAHGRIHMPEEAKKYPCGQCDKRFWTNQHLRKHVQIIHDRAQYACGECGKRFAKRHLLRTHVAEVHSPPGTNPFPCDHCSKSFKQQCQLKAHLKTHDPSRYMCVHEECLLTVPLEDRQFANWTALQRHIKTAHPPRCPHPECGGQVFASRTTLKTHLELHRKKERGEIAAITRRPKRKVTPEEEETLNDEGTLIKKLQTRNEPDTVRDTLGLDRNTSLVGLITGADYAVSASSSKQLQYKHRKYPCPFSTLLERKLIVPSDQVPKEEGPCPFRFYRLYDVERHLKSFHLCQVGGGVVAEFFRDASFSVTSSPADDTH